MLAPVAVKQPTRPRLIQILGPGLVTGASDDDPSGIATYSQAGAQFGYGIGWTLLFSYPLMVAIQRISALIGRVTGIGIAGNLRRHYPLWILYGIVALLVTANTINLAADLGAMSAALGLLVGGPQFLYVALFGLASTLLQIFMRYSRYATALKWMSLSLLAYAATAIVVRVPIGEVLRGLVLPQIEMKSSYVTMIVAILGTTISPYLFFWQAGAEVEEERESPNAKPLKQAPEQASHELERIRIDTYIGMGFSNLIALFIVVTAAATLHARHVTDILTSADAAEALRPIAGRFAFGVFAAGIVGTAILAVPVLAGSAAYAVGELFGWSVGLARRPRQAKKFYVVVAGIMLVGVVLNFMPIDPIKGLFWSAVINGVVAVPVMVMMMLLASNQKVMLEFAIGRWLKRFGWLATFVMALAAVGMIATWGS